MESDQNYKVMENLDKFVKRLDKIGIKVQLGLNFPWIYLDSVNGHRVTEIFECEHGFCIGFYPIRQGQRFKFTDLSEIFKIIRKYR